MLSEDIEELYDDKNDDKNDDMKYEKYYWETADGKLIKVDELEESHIINIVIKFGKDKLNSNGYKNIVNKFNEIRKKNKVLGGSDER